VAKLDSYGPDLFGALVPVAESDFGCRGPRFGGELTLKKARLNPGGEPVVVRELKGATSMILQP
jgi:hypothetical protein